ncbi:Uma2 family endonuclease [Nonomuraea sp. NN258]|uniref:Uma2 family endonuclease n=1 Tax=Nonomuraea antri TaxID=2730852 RepID=UPI0015696F2B|nr:Uma2 family endonuclease [Nonomuraea antri]NRQ39571.1 Uma2 family endonuclease [Nonomuraea antri]
MEGDEEMSALAHEAWLVAHAPPREAVVFPAGGPSGFTVDDWLKLPEIHQRIELIDGSFVVSPSATSLHALCAGGLRNILNAAARAAGSDLAVIEAFNIEVVGDGFIPDVVVLPRPLVLANMTVVAASEVAAVAEVVSAGPGNHKRDYQDKPPKYAAAGIPVFIRVEIEGADFPRVEVLELGADGYETVTQAKPGETVTLSEPFPVSFDPADLLHS